MKNNVFFVHVFYLGDERLLERKRLGWMRLGERGGGFRRLLKKDGMYRQKIVWIERILLT